VRFDDVSDDWLLAAQAAASAAALHAARLAAAGALVAGPVAGHPFTAEETVEILLARDIADPRFDIIQPYESRWALLVVRAALGLDVANDAVSDARDRGTTWASIAEIMGGVTPQAAQQRFGKKRSPTDSGKR
jgi:hypothetical protein